MAEPRRRSPLGLILTPSGWTRGELVIGDGGTLAGIDGVPVSTPDDPELPYILPGFVDLHVHGGMGVDYASGEAGIRDFIGYHARNGTVAIAPTTSTAPVETIERALREIEQVRRNPGLEEPTVLGVHLEGPFINPGKLGAQRDLTIRGDVALARRWAGMTRLIVATVAPEVEGNLAVAEALIAGGCRVQIGHSLATADQAAVAFARGFSGFTHLFNAMSGLDHRQPGVAAYALAHGRYAELICDLHHVHPALVVAAYRAIPGLYAITDATTPAGCPDGEYDFGGDHPVVKKGQVITLAGGSALAGSAITMLDAFRNLVSIGLSVAEASALCATRQTQYLALDDFGRLTPGRAASFVVMDKALRLQSVWQRGHPLE